MLKITSNILGENNYIRMSDMRSGDIGIIRQYKNHKNFNGLMVLKGDVTILDISTYLHEWEYDLHVESEIFVELLPKGSKLTFEVK